MLHDNPLGRYASDNIEKLKKEKLLYWVKNLRIIC